MGSAAFKQASFQIGRFLIRYLLYNLRFSKLKPYNFVYKCCGALFPSDFLFIFGRYRPHRAFEKMSRILDFLE